MCEATLLGEEYDGVGDDQRAPGVDWRRECVVLDAKTMRGDDKRDRLGPDERVAERVREREKNEDVVEAE